MVAKRVAEVTPHRADEEECELLVEWPVESERPPECLELGLAGLGRKDQRAQDPLILSLSKCERGLQLMF
jgi:hypothetical protein